MNKAIIFGVTGQDGSYLSEYLLELGYTVVGVKRYSSTNTEERLENCLENKNFHLLTGDITDYASVSGVFKASSFIFNNCPMEVYNLAAQSHVSESFKQPLATFSVDAVGVLNILEVIRREYVDSRFYQASTSEMFGDNFNLRPKNSCEKLGIIETEMIQDETTNFSPRSPYAVAKVAAHHAVKLYRDSYGIFACCGILFNHESPRRGENFVTRKVTKYVGWLKNQIDSGVEIGEIPKLQLGNLDAKRDWGHAKDYVRAMRAMICDIKPGDYVVATGESHSIRELCEVAFNHIGLDYKEWIEINPEFIRPSEVPHLQGETDKIKNCIGWEPQIKFSELIQEMVEADIIAEGDTSHV